MSPLLSKKSFDASKCVSLLELTLKRIKILRNKRSIIAKQSRDDVAKLLQKGQDANAAARAEHAFREGNIVGAYDLLEQYCQLIIKHISALKSQTECPAELKEAIASLIYAAPRCGDLQELQKIRDIFTLKYGEDSSVVASELKPDCVVNTQIIQKLSTRPPNSDVRLNLLKEIAVEYKINWNYQKAVAASFKNGDTSDTPKASTASQTSKGGMQTGVDSKEPFTPVSMHHQEQESSAVQSDICSKANPEPTKLERANPASEAAGRVDKQKPTLVSSHRDGHKGQASSAAQNTTPSTPHDISPRRREFVGASKNSNVGTPTSVGASEAAGRVDKQKPTLVSSHRDGQKGQASPAAQNTTPSIPHDISPRRKEFVGAIKNSNVYTPTSVGNHKPPHVPVHHDRVKEQESLPAQDAVPLTVHKGIPKQRDFLGARQISDVGLSKQKSNLMFTGRDELKGRPSLTASNANISSIPNSVHRERAFTSPSQVSDGGTPTHVGELKPASVSLPRDELTEKSNPELHNAIPSTAHNNVSRPKAFVNPIQASAVSMPKSPERRKPELDGLKGQATSTPAFYQAKVSPKASPHLIMNHTTNASAESLAAKQYMNSHKSYIKVDTAVGEQDHRSKDNSQASLKSQHGVPSLNVDPYVLPRQEGRMDYRNVSHFYNETHDPRRSARATDGEEDDHAYEYYAREKTDGAYYQRVSNVPSGKGASSSQMSKGGGDTSVFSSQARHELKESSLNYQKSPSTLLELSNGLPTMPASSLAHPELRSGKMKAEHELSDPETAAESIFVSAARAASAAKAAIDMVRTNSGRKMVDANRFQKEHYPKTSLNSSSKDGRTLTEGMPCMVDSKHSSMQNSSRGKLGKVDDSFKPERMQYRDLSSHAEILSRKQEIRVIPHVHEKALKFETEGAYCEFESRNTCYDTSMRKKREEFKEDVNVGIQKKQVRNLDHTEPFQEQEPVFYDSEIPQFDDYSSDESSVEEPPFYSKGRPATRKDDAQVNKTEAPTKPKQSGSTFLGRGSDHFVKESLHPSVKTNLPQSFSESLHNDDDDAESVDLLSSKSSCSSYQHPQFDEYEESNNVHIWSSTPPTKSNVSGVNTRITNGGSSVENNKHTDMRTHLQEQQWQASSASEEHVDTGALRWRASVPEGLAKPIHDAGKQRWNLRGYEDVNEPPPLQAHIRASQYDHNSTIPAHETQVATGRVYGVSRRSVRSSRAT